MARHYPYSENVRTKHVVIIIELLMQYTFSTNLIRFYASLTIFLLTSPKKCGIFVKKSRIIQTVEAEIKAVDAPTESSGWWDPGGDADCQMDR